MPNYILGKDGKFYVSATAVADATNATNATKIAAATLVNNVRDVEINLSKDTVEITSRASTGFKQRVGTLKDATITTSILWQPGDANFETLRDAYLNDTEVYVAALDQTIATAGAQGIAGNFNVVDFSRGEPLGDVMTASVELSPSTFTNWFEKAA